MSARSTGRRVGAAVRTPLVAAVRHVVVDPFRRGRLGLATLPPDLRLVALLGLGVIVVLLAMIVASRTLAARLPTTATDLGVSFPSGTAQVVAVALLVGLSLVFVGCLHLRPALRVAGWLLVSLFVALGASPTLYTSVSAVTIPLAVAAGLAILLVRAWNRPFRLAEFALTLALLTAGWTFAWLVYGLRVPGGPVYLLSGLVGYLLPLVTPVAALAGLALAEIVVALAVAAGTALAPAAPVARRSRWVPLGLALVAVVVLTARGFPPVPELIWSVLLAATAAVGWVLIGARVRSFGGGLLGAAYDPEYLWEGFRRPTWLLALAGTAPFWAQGLVSLVTVVGVPLLGPGSAPVLLDLRIWLGGSAAQALTYLLIATGALVLLVRAVRHGQVVLARLLWVVVAVVALLLVDLLRLPFRFGWSADGVATAVVLGTAGWVVWLTVSRRGSPGELAALATLLLLGTFYPFRAALADPITAVIGAGVASVLLLSSVWQILTEGAPTRADTPGLPRSSRVLLFLGYQLIWVLAVAVLVLTRDPGFEVLLVAVSDGDRLLGTILLLVAALALATAARAATRRRPLAPVAP